VIFTISSLPEFIFRPYRYNSLRCGPSWFRCPKAQGMAKLKKRSSVRRRTPDAPYNADYFAQKHDISLEQARELMRKIGRDRDKLNEAAAKLFRK